MKSESILAWRSALEDLLLEEKVLNAAYDANEWFLPELQIMAIRALIEMLEPCKLLELRDQYAPIANPCKVGLILAGNIPLVGFQDILIAVLSGHEVIVKPSHKDRILTEWLVDHAPNEIRPKLKIANHLLATELDYLIATGSNNTARQIGAEFRSVPHILIRRNRYSVAIITGAESDVEMAQLAKDILLYHGMGCRSVSNLFVPRKFDLRPLLDAIEPFDNSLLSDSWWEVQKYQSAILKVLGNELSPCNVIQIKEVEELGVPNFGELNVIRYDSSAENWQKLASAKDDLQCVVGQGFIPFGEAQCPEIDDWADGVDVLQFLTTESKN